MRLGQLQPVGPPAAGCWNWRAGASRPSQLKVGVGVESIRAEEAARAAWIGRRAGVEAAAVGRTAKIVFRRA